VKLIFYLYKQVLKYQELDHYILFLKMNQ